MLRQRWGGCEPGRHVSASPKNASATQGCRSRELPTPTGTVQKCQAKLPSEIAKHGTESPNAELKRRMPNENSECQGLCPKSIHFSPSHHFLCRSRYFSEVVWASTVRAAPLQRPLRRRPSGSAVQPPPRVLHVPRDVHRGVLQGLPGLAVLQKLPADADECVGGCRTMTSRPN